MMYSKADKFFNELAELAGTAKSVDIATYGAYLGFSKNEDWHITFPVPARTFIEQCPTRTRILIGYANYDPPQCIGCSTYKAAIDNKGKSLGMAIGCLKLNVRTIPNCHAKLYRIDDRWWVGGMNLGRSDAFDFMIEVMSGKKKLQDYFDILWKLGDERKEGR